MHTISFTAIFKYYECKCIVCKSSQIFITSRIWSWLWENICLLRATMEPRNNYVHSIHISWNLKSNVQSSLTYQLHGGSNHGARIERPIGEIHPHLVMQIQLDCKTCTLYLANPVNKWMKVKICSFLCMTQITCNGNHRNSLYKWILYMVQSCDNKI